MEKIIGPLIAVVASVFAFRKGMSHIQQRHTLNGIGERLAKGVHASFIAYNPSFREKMTVTHSISFVPTWESLKKKPRKRQLITGKILLTVAVEGEHLTERRNRIETNAQTFAAKHAKTEGDGRWLVPIRVVERITSKGETGENRYGKLELAV